MHHAVSRLVEQQDSCRHVALGSLRALVDLDITGELEAAGLAGSPRVRDRLRDIRASCRGFTGVYLHVAGAVGSLESLDDKRLTALPAELPPRRTPIGACDGYGSGEVTIGDPVLRCFFDTQGRDSDQQHTQDHS